VDVTLDMRQVRTTTEDVTAPAAAAGEVPTGVVVRERETIRDAARSLPVNGAAEGATTPGSQRELEYQVGRRVENVALAPGSVTRLHALAIVREPLDEARIEQVRKLLGHAVGAVPERGDTVHIQPMASPSNAVATSAPWAAQPMGELAQPAHPAAASAPASRQQPSPAPGRSPAALRWMLTAAAALLIVMAAGLWIGLRRRSRAAGAGQDRLSEAARAEALGKVRGWLADRTEARQDGAL